MTWMCIGFTSLAFKHSFLFKITSFQVFEIFHAFALVDCRRMSNEAKEVLKSWPKKAFEKLKSQNRWDLAPTCLDISAPILLKSTRRFCLYCKYFLITFDLRIANIQDCRSRWAFRPSYGPAMYPIPVFNWFSSCLENNLLGGFGNFNERKWRKIGPYP